MFYYLLNHFDLFFFVLQNALFSAFSTSKHRGDYLLDVAIFWVYHELAGNKYEGDKSCIAKNR